jgi:hypothetical protein
LGIAPNSELGNEEMSNNLEGIGSDGCDANAQGDWSELQFNFSLCLVPA